MAKIYADIAGFTSHEGKMSVGRVAIHPLPLSNG